jgi:hypothetical protein
LDFLRPNQFFKFAKLLIIREKSHINSTLNQKISEILQGSKSIYKAPENYRKLKKKNSKSSRKLHKLVENFRKFRSVSKSSTIFYSKIFKNRLRRFVPF